ncbi:MAG: AhpC/TSA family protein [Chlorobi bacterium]|nr:AhpC/TSA family protein [Chlorobiota bacterium]
MRKSLLIIILSVLVAAVASAQEELPVGTLAPDFTATNHQGKTIDLKQSLEKGPVVIVFYRGEWCKHCNNYMHNLQDSLPMINALGATVIAITPEQNESIDETIQKTGASFSIIWDKDHRIMDEYKVSFKLKGTKNTAYKVAGINVRKASGSDHRILPVPATYIIGTDGRIKGGYFNTDYTLRMPVKDILEVLDLNNNSEASEQIRKEK